MTEKIKTIIAIIIGLVSVVSIAYGGFKFYSCKADKMYVEELKAIKADRAELELVKNDLYITKLEQYRRHVQQRIWDIQRQYPNNYQQNPEWRQLVEQLRQLDVRISAYYQQGGR